MSLDSSEVPEEEDERVPCSGFRVKYLGCATFSRKRSRGRIPKGIASMQRPLLELYAGARKRGEAHRSAHPLALDQRLDVLDYGLVVAEKDQDLRGDQNQDLVLVKVLTPLSNAVLWAAVRFQAKALRKRVFGAAFVPIACCDGVLDRKGYLRLDSKHRFLVSLSHPSVFACVFRRVSDPRSFECHAFACGSAREALALGSAVSLVRDRCDLPPVVRPWPAQPLPPPLIGSPRSVDTDETRTSSDMAAVPPSGKGPPKRRLPFRRLPDQRNPSRFYDQRRYHTQLLKTESEEESNSYASVHKGNRRIERQIKDSGQRPSRPDVEDVTGVNGWAVLPPAPSLIPPSSADQTSAPFFPLLDTRTRDNELSSSNYSCSLPPSDADLSNPDSGTKLVRHKGDHKSSSPFVNKRRDVWTMTDRPVRTIHEEELVQTIDLSSESGSAGGSSSVGSSALAPFPKPHRHPTKATTTTETGSTPAQPVKYTYFGYETFRPPTSKTTTVAAINSTRNVAEDQGDDNVMGRVPHGHPRKFTNKVAPHPTEIIHNGKNHTGNKAVSIKGNGTGKVTISVPFSQKNKQQENGRLNNCGSSGRSSTASTQTDVYNYYSAPDPQTSLLSVRGVRSFRSDRGVGDWSTLSQTTSDEASCLGSQKHLHTTRYSSSSSSSSKRSKRLHRLRNQHHHQQQPHHQQHKMLRWRSEDRLPTQRTRSSYAFFWSLKRLSLQSLTKAKHKTGKFISSMRTKLMGQKKSSEGSEDSAYDTSEVCLSPDGRPYNRSCTLGAGGSTGSKAKRQQSWSFHDLRMATEERQRMHQSSSPAFLPLKSSSSHNPSPRGHRFNDNVLLRSSSSTTLHQQQQQHKRRQRRKLTHRRRLSSSDSGVEEYPSDQGSGGHLKKTGSESTLNNPKVTRVQVHHGMSADTFQRWSHTNLQDELGYIP